MPFCLDWCYDIGARSEQNVEHLDAEFVGRISGVRVFMMVENIRKCVGGPKT